MMIDIKIITDFLLHLLVSIICGLIVGALREKEGKEAGIKTHSVVCIGATMATYISILLFNQYGETFNSIGRVISAVIQGIGFLGAGLIIKTGEQITGLTSAAIIWLVAIIGIVAGTDYWHLALIMSALYRILIPLLRKIENKK